jgi:hypothetical protein
MLKSEMVSGQHCMLRPQEPTSGFWFVSIGLSNNQMYTILDVICLASIAWIISQPPSQEWHGNQLARQIEPTLGTHATSQGANTSCLRFIAKHALLHPVNLS